MMRISFLVVLFIIHGVVAIDSWVVFSSQPLKLPRHVDDLIVKSFNKDENSNFQQKRGHPETKYLYRLAYDEYFANSASMVSEWAGEDSGMIQVEPNIRFKRTSLVPTNSWALDRLNQNQLPLDGKMTRHPLINGTGQHIYVGDTGVYDHPSLINPVQYDYDAYNSIPSHSDCNSHGSHCACLAASEYYGVAPYATIHSITVLDCDGGGYLDDLVGGLKWIYNHGVDQPSVVTLSLGSPQGSAIMTELINNLVKYKQYIVTVAAGNDYGRSACNVYPAWINSVVAVGATGIDDSFAYFTNIGSCVDIYAPGDQILSCGTSGDDSALKSGTSMANPLVAGGFALIHQTKKMYPMNMPHGSNMSPQSIMTQLMSVQDSRIGARLFSLQFDAIYQEVLSYPTVLPPPSGSSVPSLPSPSKSPRIPLLRSGAESECNCNYGFVYFVSFLILITVIF